MREFIKCLINSNRQTLNLYGPKIYIDLEFKILQDSQEDFSDVSMQIKSFKNIPNKDSFLSELLASRKENNISAGIPENFEIKDGSFIGQKGSSYYFFAIDNDGTLRIYTPIGPENYSSPYRKPFEGLLNKICQKNVSEKVMTVDLLKGLFEKNKILEVVVLPNKWELQNLMDIKLIEEKSYKVDNKYQDNFFFNKLDVVMKDIKNQRVESSVFNQHYEEIYL